MKIVTIVGARPQFVKAAIVSRALQQTNLQEVLVHTGQHYDDNMSKIFFDELEIHKIDYQLGVGSGTQGKQTGEMIIQIENILMQEKPDRLLIYGDTNSTLAGAIAATKLHIPIAHVEAGLRSYNRKMPEEINRLVADQLSDILFTPTETSVTNLLKEGYSSTSIVEVGDVMYDAALYYGEKAKKKSNILSDLQCDNGKYILATIHRAENTNHLDNLVNIFTGLERVSETLPIILPLHPRTRNVLEQHYPKILSNSKIKIIAPLGYLDMTILEKQAALIVTDSGGVQKEAYFYQVPCVTLRDETEWVETVALGWNNLVKPDNADNIHQQIMQSLTSRGRENHYPYGKGNASQLIANHLQKGH